MKCPKCRLDDQLEEWGESGVFWLHCHRCDLDFDNTRLTPEELRMIQMVQLVSVTKEPDDAHFLDVLIQKLVAEIKLLGGPKCINCEQNQARYTTDRCAICDMLLPPDERGTRL